ncbi:MAG: glycoside hydrolase family 9 protein, partial [Rhodanobacteraceae bacterium]
VMTGVPHAAGRVDGWRDWQYWTIDFSALQTPGRYRIDVTGSTGVRSFPFRIADDVLERYTLSNVIYYLKGQRVSGDFARADAHLKRPGGQGGYVDLRGGWYDATGDYGVHLSQLSYASYFNTQQVPLVAWSLASTWRNLEATHDVNFAQYERRLIDEATYGADFLVRDHMPGGSFYLGVSAPGVGKLARDRVVEVETGDFQIKANPQGTSFGRAAPRGGSADDPRTLEVSFRSGGGVAIAALAAASTLPGHGDFTSQRYLETAEAAFRFLQQHNDEVTNDGKANILDDYCALLAATELYRANHDEAYREAADQWADRLMGRLVTHGGYRNYWRAGDGLRPFFSASDAGLPVVALAEYAGIAVPAQRRKARAAIRASLEFELGVTGDVNNPFDYARQLVQTGTGKDRKLFTAFFFPHDTPVSPWWQGEDARLASMAAAARAAALLFGDDPAFQVRLQDYAWSQLHWILGRNPYDTSMLVGSGYLNAQYLFFNSWEYTSAPGAIINGITSALDQTDHADRGITFDEGYAETGKDDDWRWTEQWLPHAAWYLYAVSLPHD